MSDVADSLHAVAVVVDRRHDSVWDVSTWRCKRRTSHWW